MLRFLTLIILLNSVSSQISFDLRKNDNCTSTLTNSEGVCVDIQHCESFNKNRSHLNICSFEKRIPIICCPRVAVRVSDNEKRKSATKCDEYSKISAVNSMEPMVAKSILTSQGAHTQFVGGVKSYPNEFPHMSAIGTNNGLNIEWRCGGSLISEEFVVTAAHCKTSNKLETQIVRIGDKNLKRDDDGAHPQDFGMKNFIVHPEYKRAVKYHDIALVQLSKRAIFNGHVRPACLHQSLEVSEISAQAMGWGATTFGGEESEELLTGFLNIVKNSECNKSYIEETEILPSGIIDKQLCAGDSNRQKDTCQGDSGGPLQLIQFNKNQDKYYVIIGITSFGRYCASGVPGVYTRIFSYINWIENVVWP